jgi:hypothetical protein
VVLAAAGGRLEFSGSARLRDLGADDFALADQAARELSGAAGFARRATQDQRVADSEIRFS